MSDPEKFPRTLNSSGFEEDFIDTVWTINRLATLILKLLHISENRKYDVTTIVIQYQVAYFSAVAWLFITY